MDRIVFVEEQEKNEKLATIENYFRMNYIECFWIDRSHRYRSIIIKEICKPKKIFQNQKITYYLLLLLFSIQISRAKQEASIKNKSTSILINRKI